MDGVDIAVTDRRAASFVLGVVKACKRDAIGHDNEGMQPYNPPPPAVPLVDASSICEHLRPLAQAIIDAGIALSPTESPYNDKGTWFACDCTFDEAPLRARLGLDPALRYAEYEGMAAGSDATWNCDVDNQILMGPHPRHIGSDTKQLG